MESHSGAQSSSPSRFIIYFKAHATGPDRRKKYGNLAMLLWTIWSCQNQIRANNADYPTTQVAVNAQKALQEFSRANANTLPPGLSSVSLQSRWSPPPSHSWKVNFDKVTFKEIGRAGIGVVIRDSQGQAIASLAEQIHLPFSSDMVIALAAAQAIQFAQEIGCSPSILEGDSKLVIKSLCSEERSLSSFGHILESTKNMTEANSISFSHVRCIGNSVAYALTKYARHVNGYIVWMEDVPPLLYSVLEADVG